MINSAYISRIRIIVIAGLCLSSFLWTTQSIAKETIKWSLNDFTPFYIKEGPYEGQGVSDKLTAFFKKHLTDYEHKHEQMNFLRFFALAERGDLVCNPTILKTDEREEFLTYSRAFKPAYAHVLVSNHPIDYQNSGISLEKFLIEDQHSLIVQTKRSYGPKLDEIIEKAKNQGRIQEHNFPTKQLFIMLEKGRIDHFIDVENSVTYARALHDGKTGLYNIPFVEDRLNRFGYVACAKTPEGQKLIERINVILKEQAATKEFRSIIESWIAPENLQRFRKFYENEILK